MGNSTGKSIFPTFWKSSESNSSLTTLSNEVINLETFLLIWLDPHVDTNSEHKLTQTFLRKILTCLVTFNDIEECKKWLKECDGNQKIILIVSGHYGVELVPKIHHLPSIVSIHVYCQDVNHNKPWTKNYSKVQSVISNRNDLLKQLSLNQTNMENVEDSKALQIHSLDLKTASYLWYQLLFEILLSSNYLPSKSTPQKFIDILRKYGGKDEYGLDLISQFEQTYSPQQAISWLIRDTPFARFVNKALREQDIHMMFLLRFLLIDIYNQLMKHQEDEINAFRIQPMMKCHMKELLSKPGHLLVVNGFLFASTNMPKVSSSMNNNDQFETVLIDIKAKYHSHAAPFAFLRNIDSDMKEGSNGEILFMCGSIFKVGSLAKKNSIWTLELTLVNDSDVHELNEMKWQLKRTHNFFMIGDLLNLCDESEKATIYYEELLNELPKQHALIPQINKQLVKAPKAKSVFPTNIEYVLINLSLHLTEFASAMLGTLCSLTSDTIFIYNDKLATDFSQWPNPPMSIFTTAQFAQSLNNVPKCCTLFILEIDKFKGDNQRRFGTIEDLISQLVDEIVHKYRLDANEYHKTGESLKAKQQEEKANQIYHELIRLHDKFTTNNSSKQIFNIIEPSLVLLVPNHEDMNSIEQDFGDFFSSYHYFHNKYECYQHIVEHENTNNIFVIIHTKYRQTIVNSFRQISNVKYVYFYGKPGETDEKVYETRDDLCYRLTYDLIGYYAELGDKYQTNNQAQKARDIFIKGQRLCQFLSERFFLTKKSSST